MNVFTQYTVDFFFFFIVEKVDMLLHDVAVVPHGRPCLCGGRSERLDFCGGFPDQGTQGVYWGAESITGDGANKPCYGVVISIQSAAVKYPYWNKAFDATAGFSIRPVYVDK